MSVTLVPYRCVAVSCQVREAGLCLLESRADETCFSTCDCRQRFLTYSLNALDKFL